MGKLNHWLMFLSLVLLITSYINRNNFPENIDPIFELSQEPKQMPISKKPFIIEYSGVNYTVEPQYQYELYGLVVSYRHHDGDSMLHKLWNDHLNMTDVCLVWGKTAMSAYLNQFDFWNGQFTCNFKTKSSAAWNSFNQHQISNNHLISNDDDIRKRINGLKIGDQIRLSGYLSAYSAEGGGKRGTSTTRTDTGNGACETIFINDFEVREKGKNYWRSIMMGSLVMLLLSLLIYFFSPYRVN